MSKTLSSIIRRAHMRRIVFESLSNIVCKNLPSDELKDPAVQLMQAVSPGGKLMEANQ